MSCRRFGGLSIYTEVEMNRFIYSLLAISAVFAAVSCHGNIDDTQVEDMLPVLVSDKPEIQADGKDVVTFAVTYGGEDITSEAQIRCLDSSVKMSGNTFITDIAGEYEFVAIYDGLTSEKVKVNAKHVSRFERNVCVMEFTGQWCSQCPDGALILNFLVSEMFKGQAYALAFHNDDQLAIPAEQELQKSFGWMSYPTYLTDMRDMGELNGNGCSNSIEKSLYETETYCAVAITCASSKAGVKVTAKIHSDKEMNYRVAAYVVEDKVLAWQTLGNGNRQENYAHRHVVRKVLSSSARGDNMGKIASGTEKAVEYTFVPDPSWNMANLSVAVVAIDEQGHINNMAECAADGGICDYELNNF